MIYSTLHNETPQWLLLEKIHTTLTIPGHGVQIETTWDLQKTWYHGVNHILILILGQNHQNSLTGQVSVTYSLHLHNDLFNYWSFDFTIFLLEVSISQYTLKGKHIGQHGRHITNLKSYGLATKDMGHLMNIFQIPESGLNPAF